MNYPHLKKQASNSQVLSFSAYPGGYYVTSVSMPRNSAGCSGVSPVELSGYQKTAFYAIVVIREGLEYPSTDGLNIFSLITRQQSLTRYLTSNGDSDSHAKLKPEPLTNGRLLVGRGFRSPLKSDICLYIFCGH